MVKGTAEEELWSIPSGGLEADESLEECCAREVWEETGYRIDVVRELMIKKARYGEWDAEVHYFEVKLVGGFMKIQDPDGLIVDIAWKSKMEIDEIQLQYPEDRALILDLLNE